mgnify:CR=1 FL=1
MNIESAQYNSFGGENVSITAVIGEGVIICAPLDPANRHYQAIFFFKQKTAYEIQAAE